jgi:hypothetical protein
VQLKDLLELGAREGMRRYVEKRAGVMLPLAVGAMVPGIVHKAMDRVHSTEHQLEHGDTPKTAALPPWLAMPLAQFAQSPGKAMKGLGSAAMGAAGHTASRAGREMMGSGMNFEDPKPSGLKGSFSELGASPVSGVAGGISGGISEMIKRKMLGKEFGEKKDPFHMGAGAAVQSFGKEMGSSGANLLRDIANKAMEAAGHAGDSSAREAIIGDLKRTDSVLAGADDATLMEAYHTMTRFAPVLSTDKNAVRSFLRQAVMSGAGPDFMSIKLLADSERAVTGGKEKR